MMEVKTTDFLFFTATATCFLLDSINEILTRFSSSSGPFVASLFPVVLVVVFTDDCLVTLFAVALQTIWFV
jgi:hypothetical protein